MSVIDLARELGKALQQDEVYINYMAATQANDENALLQEMLGRFNTKRAEINAEISKKDKDAQTLARLDSEFKELYRMIMDTPGMIAYNSAKAELDKLLQFVNQIVVGSANGEDPDGIEMVESCGGDCSGCQGCH